MVGDPLAPPRLTIRTGLVGAAVHEGGEGLNLSEGAVGWEGG